MSDPLLDPELLKLHKKVVKAIQAAKRSKQLDYSKGYGFNVDEINEIEKNPLLVPARRLVKYMALINADRECLMTFDDIKQKLKK